MNAIDRFFLRFFMLPAVFYKKAGIDVLQLKAILSIKLTMDNRRQVTFKSQNQTKEKKEINKATLGTMLGALIMGFLMIFSFVNQAEFTTELTFFMTMFIFMLCLTLITDFTSVLIDVRDNFIILPKPISDATFVASRLLHITIRTSLIVVPMVLPSFIFVAISQGIFSLLPFLLMVLMSTLFSIFLINAVYILILKITTPSRFQSIISYIQIFFTIVVMAGYQLFPRMMNNAQIEHLRLDELPYFGLYPPYWFAKSCQSLSSFDFSGNGWLYVLLSLVVPVLSVWVVVRYFAPSFNRKLSMITARTEETSSVSEKTRSAKKNWLPEKLASWFTRAGSEYMGFLFVWKMMSRSRDFKLKVYPAFGSILVLAFVFLYGMPGEVQSVLLGENSVKTLLIITYVSSLILITALSNLPYSDKYKASWIFYTAPVESPGLVISGAVKSAIVSFYTPIALIVVILGLFLAGPGSMLNTLLSISNVLLLAVMSAYLTVRKLPFSHVLDGSANGGTFIKTMMLLVGVGLVGVIHFFLSGMVWAVLALLIVSLVVISLVFHEIKKLDWKDLS